MPPSLNPRLRSAGFREQGQTAYRAGVGHNAKRTRAPVTFAITFDLDTKILEEVYPQPSWQNAYKDVGRFLRSEGFDRQQGSVYFGNDDVDVVRCQMAVQKLAFEFDWFGPAVKDIRMLRIEDNNDLMPAIELAIQMKAK
jgi:virulence-associated protein VapD